MSHEALAAEIAALREQLVKQERPMTLPEAADYMRLSRSRLYAFTSRGVIPHYKPTGKKIYFEKRDLDAFLKRNRIASRAEISEQVNG